jgi:hypothetical protein
LFFGGSSLCALCAICGKKAAKSTRGTNSIVKRSHDDAKKRLVGTYGQEEIPFFLCFPFLCGDFSEVSIYSLAIKLPWLEELICRMIFEERRSKPPILVYEVNAGSAFGVRGISSHRFGGFIPLSRDGNTPQPAPME